MSADRLFAEACRRFELSQQAVARNDRREFTVQMLAHAMCRAAWRGEIVEQQS